MTRTPLNARALPVLGAALLAVLLLPDAAAAATASAPPAGGAAIGQVIGATAAAILLTTVLLVFGLGHRSGRIRVLGQVADEASRVSGLPGWAAVPAGLAAISLIGAVFGLYWDISLHIDNGRDPGPLANPSHYFILAGLFGIFAAGWLAIVLPKERPGPAALRITPDWEVPVGGVLMMACASFALLGFPLDDIWHRLFGQDVTLWGPTHLMMLTGAAMTLIAILVLLAEARLAGAPRTGAAPAPAPLRIPDLVTRALAPISHRTTQLVAACGGLLIGLSIYQGEFDYGVPQFRLLFHPVLIAFAASVALVTARALAGRGAALGAAIFFLVVRGTLTLIVTGVFDQSVAHFPLYLAEALIVEAVALAISPAARPYRFGMVAGALIGSLGVLAEWGWSHVWMPLAWPAHVIPDAIALALPVAVAGGVIGAFLAGALRLRKDVAATPRAWAAVGASVLVVAGAVAYLLHTTVPQRARAIVALTQVRPEPKRAVQATVRFQPPGVVRDADWLYTIAWQGHGRLVHQPLRRIGDGVYRTTAPIPVYGGWKSGFRLERGNVLASVPLFMPADSAIPVRETPAPARFARAFLGDHKVLQRELKDNVPAGLWAAGGAVVLAGTLTLLLLLGWGLVRLVEASAPYAPPARPGVAPAGSSGRAVAGVT